ncbi:MAG TPA: pyridoxamine 5'-phosphate oxidase [Dongiaceae bacterium]|jgi:pyridoxamine 5'-phosphate oxidase|nr:pyridoxamine 5'-phosphate oxidase [Dongiaceae bacterium]
MDHNPFSLFGQWLAEAGASEPNDPNAIALATVGKDGMPSVRMVLLKEWDERGFVFYTNLESRKGQDLRNHPQAAFCLHWKSLRRQIRVEGIASLVTEAEADTYFASRPRASQVGAWASKQSQLKEGWEFEKRIAEYTAKFTLGTVPRPPFWSGFRVAPTRMEFWQDKPFRLHDRLVYLLKDQAWQTVKLYP